MPKQVKARLAYSVLVVLDTIEVGGPGKGVLQFCKYAPGEVKVCISNFTYSDRRRPLFNEAAHDANIHVVKLLQKSRFDFGPIKILKQAAAESRIDIIQSHSFKAHLAAAWISRELRVPWLAFAHGWTAQDRRVRLYNELEKRFLRRTDKLCVVSDRLKSEFLQLGFRSSRVAVIHNAVERVAQPIGTSRQGESIPTLLCVGRLSHEKGQDVLIEAMARLADKEWRLIVLGDGPARGRIEALTKLYGLAERVQFIGHVKDVQSYYSQASALVLPSRSEGIPNAILEAFSYGLPVIACNVGGVREVVDDGETGFLCQPDVESLANKVEFALKHPAALKKVGRAAWEQLYPKFSPVKRAEKLVALHTGLIHSSGDHEFSKRQSTP